MRLGLASLLTAAAALLVSTGLCAQPAVPDFHSKTNMLARLSYDSSPVVQGEHICFAVSHDGDYRLVRLAGAYDRLPVRLEGKMTKDQLQQLTALLESSEFRSVSGKHGGLIREGAESFAAEILAPDSKDEDRTGTRRLQWLNADGENPFPGSVAKVVAWLKQFEAKGGKWFEYAEFPDVCPSGGLRLLQPSVAQNLQP